MTEVHSGANMKIIFGDSKMRLNFFEYFKRTKENSIQKSSEK